MLLTLKTKEETEDRHKALMEPDSQASFIWKNAEASQEVKLTPPSGQIKAKIDE